MKAAARALVRQVEPRQAFRPSVTGADSARGSEMSGKCKPTQAKGMRCVCRASGKNLAVRESQDAQIRLPREQLRALFSDEQKPTFRAMFTAERKVAGIRAWNTEVLVRQKVTIVPEVVQFATGGRSGGRRDTA